MSLFQEKVCVGFVFFYEIESVCVIRCLVIYLFYRKLRVKRSIKVPAISNKIADIPPDEYSWRKYGQKPIKGSPHPRLVNSYMLSQWPRSMFKKSLGEIGPI